MPNQDSIVTLLPLRLEIRKMIGRQQMVRFNAPGQKGHLQLSRARSSRIAQTEYWVRWYPDDIALHVPPKPIGQDEKLAFDEFRTFCERQYRELESREYIGVLAREVTAALGPGRVETLLEIYNGLRGGSLSESERTICRRYQEQALEEIERVFHKRRNDCPERRIVGQRLGWKLYYDFSNPTIAWAWRRFIEKMGVVRGHYVLTAMTNPSLQAPLGDEDYFLEKMLIDEGIKVLMPTKMRLFTVHGDHVFPLSDEDIAVDPDLFLTVHEHKKSFWLTDFETAVEKGMGVIIRGRAAQIESASWLLAVGLSPDGGVDENEQLNAILMGLWSRGELSLTAQDTPTNNTEEVDSGAVGISPQKIRKNTFLGNTKSVGELLLPIRPIRDKKPYEELSDARLLSAALGIKPEILAHVDGGKLKEQMHAEAMGLLIWRACTDVSRKHWNISKRAWMHLEGVFSKFVRARGPLPVLTAGENPYGVLPITQLTKWETSPAFLTQEDQEVLRWVKKMSGLIKHNWIPEEPPTLSKVDESKQYDTLLEILRLHRVSKELFGNNLSQNESHDHIIGHLIEDQTETPGKGYLEALAFGQYQFSETYRAQLEGIADLETTPLYRVEFERADGSIVALETPAFLARWSKEPDAKHSVLHKLLSVYVYKSESGGGSIQERIEDLRNAAQALYNLEVAQLEILMMEVFDLLTFRVDAWISALATIRMYECIRMQQSKPAVGAYGWLEKPGEMEGNPVEAEYIQAPSLPQAAAAALLRNGSLGQGAREATSPFHINLSSDRVREGSLYLDKLRQGYLAGEVLGYRLEKTIHRLAEDNQGIEDSDIYALRDAFPLPHNEGSPYSILIDGKTFVEQFEQKVPTLFSGPKLAVLRKLREQLQDSVDAAADLTVAEVVYQFMRGNASRVSAWMDFLEGDVIPPEPEFSRSQRTGKTVETKLFVAIPNQEEGTTPYTIYDPVQESFCRAIMPDWNSQSIALSITPRQEEHPYILPLGEGGLGLTPMDLVLGGQEELVHRIRHFLLDLWQEKEIYIQINEEASTPYLATARAVRQSLLRYKQKNPFEDPRPHLLQPGQIDWEAMAERLEKRVDDLLALLRQGQSLPSFGIFTSDDQVERRIAKVEKKKASLQSLFPKQKVKQLAALLPEIMGRANAPFLLPYAVDVDFTTHTQDPAAKSVPLNEYAQVREGVEQTLQCFDGQHSYQPMQYSFDSTTEIYYVPEERNSLVFLLLEEWLELVPNSEETSALAVHYPTPKAQAPNAILIAVPPVIAPEQPWTLEQLAKSLAETLELMKMRMVSTTHIVGDNVLGRYLPLSFPDGGNLFLLFPRIVVPYLIIPAYGYRSIGDEEIYEWPLGGTARRRHESAHPS